MSSIDKMGLLDADALSAAVIAYDDERRRIHGGNEQPMSERNRQTISPMIGAAITAYLSAAPQQDDVLERAAVLDAIEVQKRTFQSDEYATPQPLGSLSECFACDQIATAIRQLRSK